MPPKPPAINQMISWILDILLSIFGDFFEGAQNLSLLPGVIYPRYATAHTPLKKSQAPRKTLSSRRKFELPWKNLKRTSEKSLNLWKKAYPSPRKYLDLPE